MRNEDAFALNIYAYLRGKYDLLSKRVGPFSNVIGIFFHDLMIYYTNYFIIKNSKYIYNQEINFPYLNSTYCYNPFCLTDFSSTRNKAEKTTVKKHLIAIIIKVRNLSGILILNRKTISILFPELFPIRDLVLLPLKIKINLINNSKAYITKKYYQIDYLREIMNELCIKYSIPNSEVFINNFINYIDTQISEEKTILDSDYLLVGSNSILRNRINSSIFLCQKKKVISLSHGYGYTLQLDEPNIGYGEFSYCTYYITYGSTCLDFGVYNKPLFKQPDFIQRTPKIIENYYTNSSIRKIKNKKFIKTLYIPTAFSYNMRYGPFRDIDDEAYLKWQNALINIMENIYYKASPGQPVLVNIKDNRILQGNMIDYLHYLERFDLFIIDFFSTISNLLVATDKPIIYLNLGLRNISEKAITDFKKRVFWCDINLKQDYKSQIYEALNSFFSSEQNFVNNYSEKYNLNRKNKSLYKIIKEIVKTNL